MDRRVVAPVLIAATKLTTSLTLLGLGFRSISDDDYARVTIAQRFTVHPALDPSGTSWLPLPFWVYGGAMKAFGASLATAQVIAVLLGVCGAIGVWAAARIVGLTRGAAFLAGMLGACIPHAAYYGAAMVPDYPTAVLALVASATLVSRHGPTRFAGALCACTATLSRYETWPIALVVCGFALIDMVQPWNEPGRFLAAFRGQAVNGCGRDVGSAEPSSSAAAARGHAYLWLLGSIIVAPSGAIAWVCHGVVRHHDALFFIKRVAAYRRALGEGALPLGERLAKQPLALFTGEPELFVLVIGLILAVWLVHGGSRLAGRSWQRPALSLASVVACLIVGDYLDGAPTHHEDRVLLSVWLGCALLAGALCERLFFAQRPDVALGPSRGPRSSGGEKLVFEQGPAAPPEARPFRRGWFAASAVLVVAIATALFLRPRVTKVEPYVDRSREVRAGRLASDSVPRGQMVALFTTDYGYFAILAGLARPDEAAPLSRHDPREQILDPFATPDELGRRLDALDARYLVVPATHRPKAAMLRQVAPTSESTTPSDFVVLER